MILLAVIFRIILLGILSFKSMTTFLEVLTQTTAVCCVLSGDITNKSFMVKFIAALFFCFLIIAKECHSTLLPNKDLISVPLIDIYVTIV